MFKLFENDDILNAESVINESFFLERRLFSGSVNVVRPLTWFSGSISGSLFSIVYDKNPDNLNANKICTITYGHTTASSLFSQSDPNQKEKVKMYKLYAHKLLGDKESLFYWGGAERPEAFFVSIPRNIAKDGIKPPDEGSVFGFISADPDASTPIVSHLMVSNKSLQLPGGEAHFLQNLTGGVECGLMFKESATIILDGQMASDSLDFWSGSAQFGSLADGSEGKFDDLIFGMENRINHIRATNISKIRNTIYQCKIEKSEFNYSSNPSFINKNGQIISTSGLPISSRTQTFITTVGLVGSNGEVIAVAKISKPIKNDPDTDLLINVKLDY